MGKTKLQKKEMLQEFLEENKINVSDTVFKEIFKQIESDLHWAWSDMGELRIFNNFEKFIYWKYDSRDSVQGFMDEMINSLQEGKSSADILDGLTSDRTVSISNGMYLFCY